MLSLQSVQGEQIQAQIQSLQPQKMQSEEKTEKSAFSFIDLLREARPDSGEEKPVSSVNEGQKTAENPEKIAEKPEEKTQNDAAGEKIPQNQKTQVSKNDEDREEIPVVEADGEKIALLAAENPSHAENYFDALTFSPQNKPIALAEVSEAGEKTEVSNQIGAELNTIAWMYAKEKLSGEESLNDDIPEDALHSLLDAEAFIVPEIDTGDDGDVETLQKLSFERPEVLLHAETEQTLRNDEELIPDGKSTKVSARDKSKPRLEITDLRTVQNQMENESEHAVSKSQMKNGADFAFEDKNQPAVQMTMELAGKIEQNITSSSGQTAAANGSNFQAMLTNAIQNNAPDFVKAGNIVLRDGNQGSINLILRPEALGNVKISLSLSDKVITGQITVQSQEAYNAFKDSIDSLKAAFAQNGFEAQGFDLQFTGNQNFAQNQQEWQNPEFAIRASHTYGDLVMDDAVAVSADVYEDTAYGINIVA